MLDAAAAHIGAEELRCEIRQLVRFVQDERVRRAENVAETVLLQRQIGKQQMMIHDNEVGFLSAPAGERDMTAREFAAAAAQTVVACRGHLTPERMGVG